MATHNCGGTLRNARVQVNKRVGALQFITSVPGMRCMRCSETVISRDIARQLDDLPQLLTGHWRTTRTRGRLLSYEIPTIIASEATTTSQQMDTSTTRLSLSYSHD